MTSQTSTATLSATDAPAAMAPIAAAQRIEALDVVRGIALFGIFLMNIEFFNRPWATLNQGMPRGLAGADWWASWFVAYFVQGKFWTIFSLLFGMGFAVMMVRAEQAGRELDPVLIQSGEAVFEAHFFGRREAGRGVVNLEALGAGGQAQ